MARGGQPLLSSPSPPPLLCRLLLGEFVRKRGAPPPLMLGSKVAAGASTSNARARPALAQAAGGGTLRGHVTDYMMVAFDRRVFILHHRLSCSSARHAAQHAQQHASFREAYSALAPSKPEFDFKAADRAHKLGAKHGPRTQRTIVPFPPAPGNPHDEARYRAFLRSVRRANGSAGKTQRPCARVAGGHT